MTRFSLALSAFRRHIGRTVFTTLSVAMAFAIFTILAAIHEGLTGQISLAAAQRLTTDTGMNAPLPESYVAAVQSIPGVVAVTRMTGFDGYFRDRKNDVAVLAFSVPSVLAVYPEFILDDAEKQTFFHDRQGAIVGEELARRMGWHVGQTVPIQDGPPQRNGSTTWMFHVDGIYHTDLPMGYRNFFVVNYDYFNEGTAPSPTKDTVQQINILVDRPADMDRVAHAIDAHFANASPDTRTMSEQQETMSALRQFGDVSAILIAVGFAVFGSMLLITGNTIANSVRERLGEFAMMRALGFSRTELALLVFGEAAILIGAGAALGLLAGWAGSLLMAPIMTTIMRGFSVGWATVALAASLSLFFAAVTGLLPGRRIATLPVAATLRGA